MLFRHLTVLAVFVFAFASACLAQEPEVRVRKTGEGKKDPTLFFKGLSGDADLSKCVLSDLHNCGWFDVVNAEPADFVVSGAADGGAIGLTVSGAANFTARAPMASADKRWNSHRVVDAMLKKIFEQDGMEGICQSKIAFNVQNGQVKDIWVCDFDGVNARQLTSNNTLSLEPDWGSGNTSLVYTYYAKMWTDIMRLDVASGKSTKLAGFPGMNAQGSISPNGRLLALILSKDKNVDLYVKDVGSDAMRRITTGEEAEASPCWSPDNRRICYVSGKTGRPMLYVHDLGSGDTQKLSTVGSEAVSPTWSSDGKKIAYSAKLGGEYALAFYDFETKSSERVSADGGGSMESPSWAPDNRHVVCARRSNYKSTLVVVDTRTGEVRQLIRAEMNTTLPSWSSLFK